MFGMSADIEEISRSTALALEVYSQFNFLFRTSYAYSYSPHKRIASQTLPQCPPLGTDMTKVKLRTYHQLGFPCVHDLNIRTGVLEL